MNSPTQKRIEIESHFIPKIKAALENIEDAKDIYNADSLNKDTLIAIKTKQLMSQPVEDYGFRIRQVTHPAMVQTIIQKMMNEGYIVYEMGAGFIKFVPLQQSQNITRLLRLKRHVRKPLRNLLMQESLRNQKR
ncbi:hypothetical protein LNP20_05540 [Klebsiella pneumoniae subsp. pneumoniae]|nr:hypothetical protein [Klebsiella pneumoniae subsp. pneumoniae]